MIYLLKKITFTQRDFIKNERVIGLDFVRAISIVAVVFGHSFWFFDSLDHVPLLGKITPFFAENILSLSIFGVELFFVLSGFLIGGILIKTFVNAGDFTFSEVRNFWVRRWFRTLPNYWLILTVNFILYQALKLDLFELQDLKGYVFLQNLRHPNILNAFPEGWSLSVEEWFYLTLPVAMYVLSRFKVASKEAFLFKVFTGYLLVFVIIRFINAFNPLNGLDPDEGIRKVVLFRLDAVMYGVLFAYFNYFKPLALEKIKKHLFVLCIIGFNIIFYLSIHLKLIFFIQSDLTIRFIRNAFMYLVIPLFLSLCLPYANSVKTISNKTISKIVQHISKISYSVYLIHLSLIYRPFFKSLKFNSFSSAFMYYVLYWIIIFVLSSLIYKYFEYPVMKLRDRFSTKKAVKTS